VTAFCVLGEPMRRETFRLLAAQNAPVCVCEVVDRFGLSQPTISPRLRILRQAGLVRVSKRGVWAWYTRAAGTGWANPDRTGHPGRGGSARGERFSLARCPEVSTEAVVIRDQTKDTKRIVMTVKLETAEATGIGSSGASFQLVRL
jgi:DNA-binding transcriptional ArsR family regulator